MGANSYVCRSHREKRLFAPPPFWIGLNLLWTRDPSNPKCSCYKLSRLGCFLNLQQIQQTPWQNCFYGFTHQEFGDTRYPFLHQLVIFWMMKHKYLKYSNFPWETNFTMTIYFPILILRSWKVQKLLLISSIGCKPCVRSL